MSINPTSHRVLLLFLAIIGLSSLCNGQIIQDRYGVNHEPIDGSLVPIQKGKLFGFVDRDGKEIIKPQYEGVSFFSEAGYAKINKLGLYGLIDKSGTEIIPPISQRNITWDGVLNTKWVGLNNEEKYLYNIKYVFNQKSKKILYYKTTNNKTVSPIYTYEKSPLFDKIDYPCRNYEYNIGFYLGVAKISTPMGGINFIDTSFQKILSKDLYDGNQLSNTRFVEFDESTNGRLIDQNGKALTEYLYEKISASNLENYFVATKKIGDYKTNQILIDQKGSTIIEGNYSKISYLMDDLFIVSNGRSGVVNLKGDTIIDLTYSKISYYAENIIMAEANGEYHFLDQTGVRVSLPYSAWKQVYFRNASIGVRDGKTYLINAKAKEIAAIDAKSRIYNRIHGYYMINLDNSYFLYDEEGNKVLDEPMKSIVETSFDQLAVLIDSENRKGLYDLKNQKWVHPLGQKKVRFIAARQSYPSLLEIESDTEIVSYKSSLDNKSVVPKKSNQNQGTRTTYRQKYSTDMVTVIFEDGTQVEYKKSDKYELRTYGTNKHYFEQGRSSDKIILDKDLNRISPVGYKVNRKYEINGAVYFEMVGNDRINGLIDIKGKWIFEPKKRQSYSTLFETFWAYYDGTYYKLLDTKFQPVSDKSYQKLTQEGTSYILAHIQDSKLIDVYSKEGELISESIYTGELGSWGEYLIVEKSPNGELLSCIIDNHGLEKICLPYSSITPIDENLELFIVKDVYDFGLVDKSNNVVIDIKYKNLGYHKEISAFSLGSNNYYHDIVGVDYQPILTELKAYFKLEKLNAGGYYVGGEEGYAYFDNHGKFIKKFDAIYNKPSSSEKLFNAGLIRFNLKGKVVYADAKSGKVYN